MSSTITATQIFSISISLIASGGIATLSLFDVPELKAQPASRALPSVRWLFSRGSHIFPQAAGLSSAGFAYLAYCALPVGRNRAISQLFKFGSNGNKVNGYLAAVVLTLSIGPFTSLMKPTNFGLIKMNEDMGGARSQKVAEARRGESKGGRSAEESVAASGDPNEFTDLSGPQGRTSESASDSEDNEMRELLDRFSKLNTVRAVLLAGGGIAGLWAALL